MVQGSTYRVDQRGEERSPRKFETVRTEQNVAKMEDEKEDRRGVWLRTRWILSREMRRTGGTGESRGPEHDVDEDPLEPVVTASMYFGIVVPGEMMSSTQEKNREDLREKW